MSQKLIYIKISDRQECIEFNSNTTSNEDLKGNLLFFCILDSNSCLYKDQFIFNRDFTCSS